MPESVPQDPAILILGASSGFGLATAHRFAREKIPVIAVHRDRKSAAEKAEAEFEAMRSQGAPVISRNTDALQPESRKEIIRMISGSGLRIGTFLHSIAFGNLRPLVRRVASEADPATSLAHQLHMDPVKLATELQNAYDAGNDRLHTMIPAADEDDIWLGEDDIANTVYAMGTSIVPWVQELHTAGLFSGSACVIGLTSEGNQIAWRGYAAVSAAKNALEACVRSIATEYAGYGIRANIVQPGVTDTPALRLIPGSRKIAAQARLRNPYKRLTTPADVADVIYLLSRDEARWINGAHIHADGGEHISG